MEVLISVLALLIASAGCGLSLAVALRVKRLLDPLVEGGGLGIGRRPSGVALGTAVPQIGAMADFHGERVEFPAPGGAQWILTFQSVECDGCKQQLPEYKKFLEAAGLERGRVFSLIVGDREGAAIYADELHDLSHVVHAEDSLEQISREMGVTTWPTYSIISGSGTVSYSVHSSAQLTEGGNSVWAVPVA